MKKILVLLSMFSISFLLSAEQIDVNVAQKVAGNFLQKGAKSRTKLGLSLNLVHTAKESQLPRSFSTPNSYYYVFNIGDNNGFIIVAADNVNTPIIGYSNEGHYDQNSLPENFKAWMSDVEAGMAEAIARNENAEKSVQAKWGRYLNPTAVGPGDSEGGEPGSGNFLIKTKWNQSYPYNTAIPFRINGSEAPVTGCVATAMAQVMKYYDYPQRGKGSTLAYTTKTHKFNVPAINLAQQVYDWSNMLNEYNGIEHPSITEAQQKAVATLMYHVGASVQMNFSSSSGASTADAAKALFNFFGYDEDMFNIERIFYSDEVWTDLIKNEIKNRRPVFYEGWSLSGSGHTFICDGYDDNGLFHFNWGWGGHMDGYFTLDGVLEYNRNHQIIANIKPDNGIKEETNGFLRHLFLDKDTYMLNEPAIVNIWVTKPAMVSKTGDYYTALYTLDDEFVSLITYAEPSGDKYHRIPKTINPGSYKVKVLEKRNDSYIPTIPQKSLQYPVINVTGEIMNHTIFAKGIGGINSTGYQGTAFQITASTTSQIPVDVYLTAVLVDSNNKHTFISQPVYTPIYVNGFNRIDCKIPENMLAGKYKMMLMAKEDVDSEWSFVDAENELYKNYSDYEVFGSYTDYKVNYVSLLRNSVKRCESISVNIQFTGTVPDKSRVNNIKGALYDKNGNFVCLLISEMQSNNKFRAKSTSDTPAGDYLFRLVEEVGVETYIPVSTVEASLDKPLTLLDGVLHHELMIFNRNPFTLNVSTVSMGNYFQANLSYGHKYESLFPFKGLVAIALTDQDDNIQFILGTKTINLDPGLMYSLSSFSNNFISNLIPAGDYKVRLVAQESGHSDWGIVTNDGENYPDFVNLTVLPNNRAAKVLNTQEELETVKIAVYPNPTKDFLFIQSGSEMIQQLLIVDLNGRVVLSDNSGGNEKKFNIQSFTQGVYILKLYTTRGESTHRIVKQ